MATDKHCQQMLELEPEVVLVLLRMLGVGHDRFYLRPLRPKAIGCSNSVCEEQYCQCDWHSPNQRFDGKITEKR